jgi:hypothetical protein
MGDWFLIAIFGWPGILASLALGVAGILLKKPWLTLSGGIVVIPHVIYLIGSPFIGLGALVLPLLYGGAALAVCYRRPWIAGALLLPQIALEIWLAYIVLTQP